MFDGAVGCSADASADIRVIVLVCLLAVATSSASQRQQIITLPVSFLPEVLQQPSALMLLSS